MTDADKRIVEYERIHSIRPVQLLKLNQTIAPKNSQRILDAAAGYGSVSKSLYDYVSRKHLDIGQYLLEESGIQLKRARVFLPWMEKDRMILGSMLRTSFPDDFFDAVVIKMGLHEVPRKRQPQLFQEMRRIIKPGGKLVIWELAFERGNQKILSDIIRKKDTLAGYRQLAKTRYFPTTDEILKAYRKAGFARTKASYSFSYRFESHLRLKEEFGGDHEKLSSLNTYIDERLSKREKKQLGFSQKQKNVFLNFPKKIFVGI